MFAVMQASIAVLACSIAALAIIVAIDHARRWRK